MEKSIELPENRSKNFRNGYKVAINNETRERRNNGQAVKNATRTNTQKSGEKHKVSKEARLRRKKKALKRKLIKTGIKAGLVGAAVLGSVSAYKDYKDRDNTITLEEATAIGGIDLDRLGITEDIAQKLGNLSTKMNEIENMSNEEIIKFVNDDIGDLPYEVLEEKLENLFGTSKIEIIGPTEQGSSAYDPSMIKIDGSAKTPKDMLDNILSKLNKNDEVEFISPDIERYIDGIYEWQEVKKDVNTANFDRNEVEDECEKRIEETSKFAAKQLIIGDDGKTVTTKFIKKSNLNKVQQRAIQEVRIAKEVSKDDGMER